MEVKSDQTVDSINSLFSSIISLYILIFFYFPTIFKNLFISPVFIFTLILLAYLLKLGAIQKQLDSNKSIDQINDSGDENYIWDLRDFNSEVEYDRSSFLEWNVKAPLEIIYEAYEGEEEDDDDDVVIGNRENRENCILGMERYHSLSLYYPESDSDSSSDGEFDVVRNWELPENGGFRWDEAGEELIEIELDGKRRSQFFNEEEDNLIEIDISPMRSNEFSGVTI